MRQNDDTTNDNSLTLHQIATQCDVTRRPYSAPKLDRTVRLAAITAQVKLSSAPG